MTEEATHEVELSFYYMHYNDARKFAEMAEKEQSKLKSLYARHAILSVVFASEALINRVLAEFSTPTSIRDILEKLSITDKWRIAARVCAKHPHKPKAFDNSAEPFQSFAELIRVRNWLVHPKVEQFIEAKHTPGETITDIDTGDQFPWVDTLEGQRWPQTKIPKNPFELTASHARKVIEILETMVKKLQQYLGGLMTEDWLMEIGLRTKGTAEEKRITIDGLWGGYTPSKQID